MRRFITALCCIIVGLQILIAVPLAAGLLLVAFVGRDVPGPTALEFRVSHNAAEPQTLGAAEPSETAAVSEPKDAILEARQERGSLLAGTLLGESVGADDEQREFVSAFRQVADAESSLDAPPPPVNPLPTLPPTQPAMSTSADMAAALADVFAVEQLYAMAERDEQARIYARADQWRTLARSIRGDIDRQSNCCSTDCGEVERLAEGR